MTKFSTLSSEYIQIGRTSSPATFQQKLAAGPFADKFFAVAVVICFFTASGLGAHLWLMLNGQMQMSSSYASFRSTHALLQMYLVFAPIIVGFISQAGSKLLGADAKPNPICLLELLALIVGSTLLVIWPNGLSGKIIIGAAILTCFFLVLRLMRPPYSAHNQHRGYLFLFSLGGFLLSLFLDVTTPAGGVFLIWTGLGAAIFSGGEQFIVNFLKGSPLTDKHATNFRIIFGASIVMLFLFASFNISNDILWRIFGCFSFATLSTFLAYTKIWKIQLQTLKSPLGCAFLCSFLWAFLATLEILIYGHAALDSALHLFATGWGMTLVLAITCQIMGFLSGQMVLKPIYLFASLLLWQTVPLGRGSKLLFILPPTFSWVVITAATLVLGVWAWGILRAEWRILKRQANISQGEAMQSC